MNYRDVACPNCGTVYAVGYSDVPHSVENIHRICDTCMMPIEVKNPWNDKDVICLQLRESFRSGKASLP